MLKEGENYPGDGRHYGIKDSSVCYIEKEESKIRTLRVNKQERNVRKCQHICEKRITSCADGLYSHKIYIIVKIKLIGLLRVFHVLRVIS